MKKNILILFLLITGLFLSSCNNKKTKENQLEVTQETETKKEKVTTTKEKEVIIADFADQSIDDKLAKKLKDYIATEFLKEGDLRAIKEEQRKFQLYKIDLNNDGEEEIFINFITSYFCGTGGCTVLLLDSNLELINSFSPTQTLYVEEILENDWKILLTKSEGEWRKLIYEDGAYPSNPTIIETEGEIPSENAVLLFNEDNSNAKTYTF